MTFTLKLRFEFPVHNIRELRKDIIKTLKRISAQFKIQTPSAYSAYIKFSQKPRSRHLKAIKNMLYEKYKKLDYIAFQK